MVPGRLPPTGRTAIAGRRCCCDSEISIASRSHDRLTRISPPAGIRHCGAGASAVFDLRALRAHESPGLLPPARTHLCARSGPPLIYIRVRPVTTAASPYIRMRACAARWHGTAVPAPMRRATPPPSRPPRSTWRVMAGRKRFDPSEVRARREEKEACFGGKGCGGGIQANRRTSPGSSCRCITSRAAAHTVTTTASANSSP